MFVGPWHAAFVFPESSIFDEPELEQTLGFDLYAIASIHSDKTCGSIDASRLAYLISHIQIGTGLTREVRIRSKPYFNRSG